MSNNQSTQKLLDKIEQLSSENLKLRAYQELHRSEQNDQALETLKLAEYIIEHSPAVLFRRHAAENLKDRKMVYVSPNISRFGYRAEDLLSGKIMFRDFVHQEDNERMRQEIDRYVDEARDQYSQYYRIVTKDGELRWVEDRTSVVEDEQGNRYHQGIVIDIHDRMEAEEKLKKSEEKYRQIVETTSQGFVLMDESLSIIDLNSSFASMLGSKPEDLIGTRIFTDIRIFNNLLTTSTGNETEFFGTHEIETRLDRSGGGSIPVLIHANTLCSDDGSVMGFMAFITDISEQKKALILAGEVQKSLLPDRSPNVSGFDVAGMNIACDEVGGDYFDYLLPDNGDHHFSIVVGDISGHGVDSALLMSSARTFLRMRASQPGSGPEIITALNCHLSDDVEQSGRFMTMFYLHLDSKEKQIEWIRAGHDPALLYHLEEDRFEELKGPGLALGVDPDYPYAEQCRIGLNNEQIFIVYTDGIWEACNRHNQPYGKERLKQSIRKHAHLNAAGILSHILLDQKQYLNGVGNEDDITLVIAKYSEPDKA